MSTLQKMHITLAASLLLAACATHPKPPAGVVTQVVHDVVAVPCDPKVAARPAYPDTAVTLKGAGADSMLALLYAGRTVRNGYIAELETANAACRAH